MSGMSIKDQTHLISLNRRVWLWVGGGALVLVLTSLLVLTWEIPFSRDQGVYSVCAGIILKGGVPYRDCWDRVGPSQHYTYAFARFVFGDSPAGVHLLNSLLIILGAAGIYSILRLWKSGERASVTAATLYGLLALLVRFDANAHPESFTNLFGIAMILSILVGLRSGQRWLIVLAGVLLSVGVFFKYVFVIPFLAGAITLVIWEGNHNKRRSAFLWLVAGILIFVGGSAFYLALVGALSQAVEHIGFILFQLPRATLNPAVGSSDLLYGWFGWPVFWLLALAGLWLSIREKKSPAWPVTVYLVGAIAAILLQRHVLPSYWMLTLPPLALAVGMLLSSETFRALPRWILALSGVLALLNLGMFIYLDQWLVSGIYRAGKLDQETFLENLDAWDDIIAGEYLAERTEASDTIWVFGHHPAIYTLAGRPSPTRFVYHEPLVMMLKDGNPWAEIWQVEALDALYAAPPAYILIDSFDLTRYDFQPPAEQWAATAAFAQLTDTHYQLEREGEGFLFYRLIPYWSRANDPDLLDAVTVFDLLAMEPDAVTQGQDTPLIEELAVELAPEPAYIALRIHPPDSVTYALTLPEGPVCLRFDSMMHPDSWRWGGDGATFVVEIDAGNGPTPIFEGYISNQPADLRWHETVLDLSRFAGQSISLTLRSAPGPAQDFTGDWAMWGQPRIIRPPDGGDCHTPAILDTRP